MAPEKEKRNIRLMLVDDEPNILKGLSRQLLSDMEENWDLVLANNGDEALAKMEAHPADVVVTDIAMPGMNGEELLDHLMEHFPQAGLVILSGHLSQSTAFKRVGPDVRFLTKPVSKELLVWTIIDAFDAKLNKNESINEQIKKFINSHVLSGDISDRESRIHFINIGHVKAALSARWPTIGKKVISIADVFIRSHINKGEAYRYFDENIFAIIYPTLSNSEGKIRLRALVEQLCRKLFGDEFDSGRYGADIVDKMMTFEHSSNNKAPQKPPSKIDSSSVKDKLLSSVFIEYKPIWCPETRNVVAYRTSFRREYLGRQIFGHSILQGGNVDPLWPALYEQLFIDIVKHHTVESASSPYYVVQVPLELLLSKEFLAIIKAHLVAPGLRKRLRIEIVGIEEDIKLSLLSAVITMLSKHCDVVMARISPDSLTVHELKLFGVHWIGMNFYNLAKCGLGQRGAYVVASHFSKKANLLGLETYAWGINSVPDFQVLSSLKFRTLSGTVFSAPNHKPHTTYPLSPSLIINGSI